MIMSIRPKSPREVEVTLEEKEEVPLSDDAIYKQLMEHGRHVERERAWLLNFYIAVLAGFIYGFLEGRFAEETLRLASLILAIFSLVALIATIKLDAEYANILLIIERRFGPRLKPISRVWYRPLLSVGAWTSAFYGTMFVSFLMLFYFKTIPKVLDSLPLLIYSGAIAFCSRHGITEHVRQAPRRIYLIWLRLFVLYFFFATLYAVFYILYPVFYLASLLVHLIISTALLIVMVVAVWWAYEDM